MKNPVARPQGIKFEIREYTDICHSCESRNPEKKTGFRIPRLKTSRAGKCGMTPCSKLQGIIKLNIHILLARGLAVILLIMDLRNRQTGSDMNELVATAF